MAVADLHQDVLDYEMDGHEATFQGLHCWYKHIFQSLGWVILAKAHGKQEKVNNYLKCVQEFINSVDWKIINGHLSPSHQQDLEIMKSKVETLRQNCPVLVEQSAGSCGSRRSHYYHY